MVEAKELADLPPHKQVLISTGSQGEPLAALSRMSQSNHHFVHLEPGDTVVLAELADPGQRERRLPRDQRPVPPRRQRRAQGQLAGARLRPRQRRRAALLLQHRQAAQRDAGARRDPPHAGQRRPRARHRCRERRAGRGRRRRRPRRRRRQDRRQGRRRLRLRRRHHDRRHLRGLDEGPPDPRRGGLPVRDRGRRLGDRQGRVRPGDPRPRLRRGRDHLRRDPAADHRRDRRRRGRRAPTTPTSSSRPSDASSAAGSTARTGGAR